MEKKIPESIAGNISYPYGDSNESLVVCQSMEFLKHFVPLWGQQPVRLTVNEELHGNISYPYGDSNPS